MQTIFFLGRMRGQWPHILPVRLICSSQLRSGLSSQLRSQLTNTDVCLS